MIRFLTSFLEQWKHLSSRYMDNVTSDAIFLLADVNYFLDSHCFHYRRSAVQKINIFPSIYQWKIVPILFIYLWNGNLCMKHVYCIGSIQNMQCILNILLRNSWKLIYTRMNHKGFEAKHTRIPQWNQILFIARYPSGVCPATAVASRAVRSYRTFSPLPPPEGTSPTGRPARPCVRERRSVA
jgi:hypothetical protein